MRRQLLAAVLAALVFAPTGEAWTWPASGAVLQAFLFDSAHPYAAGQHRGIAIGGDPGETVLAPAAGTVTFAGTVPSSGKSVTIATADGYAVTLTHLGSITVARGAAVVEGDGAGTIADSGDAEVSQPYVHLGVRIAAEAQGYLDPLTFLPTRVVAPGALVPPVVAEPPAAPLPVAEPAPAPVADPEPMAVPEPAAVAVPDASAPAAASAPDPARPAATADKPVAPSPSVLARPDAENRPLRGGADVSAAHAAVAIDAGATADAAAEDALRPGGRIAPSSPARRAFETRAFEKRAASENRARATRAVDTFERTAADARGRTQARRTARRRPIAQPRALPTAPVDAVAPRHEPRRGGLFLPVLAVVMLLAAAALAEVLGAVRMMVRCGTGTQEDPGRSGVAVCGRSPSPRSCGGLRRPLGRVRALSPAEGQRRPHGERNRRARHAGDGGRRQGGEVLR